MKVEEVDNHVERLMAIGMIVSGEYLQDVQPILHMDLIETPYARTVASWCLDYWKQYKKAPGIHIQDIYKSKARNGLDKDQAELISEFLESISHEYERSSRFNVEYLLTQTEARFKSVSLRNLSEDIASTLSEGDVKEAEALLTSYKRVENPKSKVIEVLTNKDSIYDAFESREKDILYTRPGALGDYLGPVERSTLTAIMGPEKRGKTWMLTQEGLWALPSRCNVAFFECGDMNQRDLIRRIFCSLTRSSSKFFDEPVKVPIMDCALNQDNTCRRKERKCDFGVISQGEHKATLEEAEDYVPCTACKKLKDSEWEGAYWHKLEEVQRLTWDKAVSFGKRMSGRIGKRRFMLSIHPAKTINVQGIKSLLDLWERTEDFIPDVIIVDYADILAPEDKRMEFRHQQNDTWMALRALSQERHCAVITATQADADSYTKNSLGMSNFSEDKRKYGHATMFITLNQTQAEKEEGIMRIGKMMVREDNFNLRQQCTILQCLDISRPYLGSFIKKKSKKILI